MYGSYLCVSMSSVVAGRRLSPGWGWSSGPAPVSSGPYKHDPLLICDGRMAALGLGSVTADHIWSPSLVLPGSYSADFYVGSKTLGN